MRRTAWGMIVGSVLAVIALAISVSAQAQKPSANPLVGTWKFNPQKSKMSNSLPPRVMVRTYEDRGGGVIIFSQEMTDAGGARVHSLYVAKEDGQDYPLVIAFADTLPARMISFKRVDAFTVEQTEKALGGNVTATGTRSVSQDGRTMTLTVRAQGGGGGDDAAGSEAAQAARRAAPSDILIFEKQ